MKKIIILLILCFNLSYAQETYHESSKPAIMILPSGDISDYNQNTNKQAIITGIEKALFKEGYIPYSIFSDIKNRKEEEIRSNQGLSIFEQAITFKDYFLLTSINVDIVIEVDLDVNDLGNGLQLHISKLDILEANTLHGFYGIPSIISDIKPYNVNWEREISLILNSHNAMNNILSNLELTFSKISSLGRPFRFVIMSSKNSFNLSDQTLQSTTIKAHILEWIYKNSLEVKIQSKDTWTSDVYEYMANHANQYKKMWMDRKTGEGIESIELVCDAIVLPYKSVNSPEFRKNSPRYFGRSIKKEVSKLCTEIANGNRMRPHIYSDNRQIILVLPNKN